MDITQEKQWPKKKVILHEFKRHTTHHISSIPSAVLSREVPHSWPGGHPGVPLTRDGVPSSRTGIPPGQVWGTPQEGNGMEMGFTPSPPPLSSHWNYYLSHPSDAGGNKRPKVLRNFLHEKKFLEVLIIKDTNGVRKRSIVWWMSFYCVINGFFLPKIVVSKHFKYDYYLLFSYHTEKVSGKLPQISIKITQIGKHFSNSVTVLIYSTIIYLPSSNTIWSAVWVVKIYTIRYLFIYRYSHKFTIRISM